MAFLHELIECKESLMRLFLTNRRLVDLLANKPGTALPALELRYKQVFPYHWAENTVSEEKAFLCFSIGVPHVQSPSIKDVDMRIWVFAHEGIMRTSEGPRIDLLAAAVDDLLNGRGGMGIGDVALQSVGDFNAGQKFYGHILKYCMKDFNRSYRELRKRGEQS